MSWLLSELEPGVPMSCWFVTNMDSDSTEVFQNSDADLCFVFEINLSVIKQTI